LNRQEFVIVGWSDPEGTRPHLGALLLGYYTDDGKLIYAGRVGTGMSDTVLADLRRRLEQLSRAKSSHRPAQHASDRRSFSRVCIGSNQSLWPRSPI
jgi:bifunctional non-homologous end joining protein LigD